MRVFITGGSGFIGTNYLEYLISFGAIVVNYDIAKPRNQNHLKYWQKGDILDVDGLKLAVRQFDPDYIVHLAARTDLNGVNVQDYSTNIEGVSNVIDALKEAGSLERVLFASSRLVCKIGYQPKSDTDYVPTTPYGHSKVLGEQLVRDNAEFIPCPWMIFRPTSIWGPWFDVPYKDFFMMIMKDRYVHPTGKRIRKSFGYIGNSVYMIDKFLSCDANEIHGKTLYLTDYPELEVNEWASLIATKLGNRPPRNVSLPILKLAALCGDCMKAIGWKNPPITSFRLNNLLTEMLHETKEVKAICGDLPFSLETGVEDTLAWINNGK